jgi:allophanate hydrolase
VAEHDAHVVQLLRKAGAILVGKTNLDQFASGLVGTRSPYGIVPNAFDASYIAGGSSSGSAALVARGIVPLALGTDTAGSGRVPAAFNNIVGLKPTRGLLSTRGLVPACRTLDCVSLFALTVADAELALSILAQFDAEDPYARGARPSVQDETEPTSLRLGILSPLRFFDDSVAQAAFEETVAAIQGLNVELVPIDSAPFFALAELLYGSAWVTERALVAEPILAGPAEWMDPSVRTIIQAGWGLSARQAFSDEYRRATLSRKINSALAQLDALMVPTTPTIFRIQEVMAEPLATNSRLGTYTNFTNLADLCAVAIPGRFRADRLPSGITLLGPAFSDRRLARLARRFEGHLSTCLGATPRTWSDLQKSDGRSASLNRRQSRAPACVEVAVVGAHLDGLALNHQLTARGGTLVRCTTTSPQYRLYLLSGAVPAKPGLERTERGAPIALEVWRMPLAEFGSFVQEIPPPLGIGNVELVDGSWVKGFICEHAALVGARDITEFGGFRASLAAQKG